MTFDQEKYAIAKRRIAESQRHTRDSISGPRSQTEAKPRNQLVQKPTDIVVLPTAKVLRQKRIEQNPFDEAERRIASAGMKKTTNLHLAGLGLTALPESLSQLTGLQSLNLSNNHLTVLPESFGKLTKLKNLNIQQNRLESLPESLGQLSELRALRLEDNQLKVLPKTLSQLTRLKTLDLSNNLLTALPEIVGKLHRLRKLDLRANHLVVLPEQLGQLKELRILNLSANCLVNLPENTDRLLQLEELDLSANRLTNLPDPLAKLVRIRKLFASGNSIEELPEWLCGLRRIEILCISDASLTSIPRSLCSLGQLCVLDVARNQITTLPDTIGLLSRLRYLDFSDNCISPLPRSLCDLRQLRVLRIHGNPDCNLPPELQSVSPAAVLDYYFSILVSRPLNEAKMILVGRGGVGKTSLVGSLVHGCFNPSETKTDGIDITQWPVKIGPEEVRLNIWDFGGQEIMHATHQFFLTKRSLYLLVLNAREGEQDANVEYWLRLIQSFGGDSPVLIIINKADAHPFDLNRRGLKEKFSTIRDFIQTDCESKLGIAELRQSILRETGLLDHLRDPFPEGWFSVKDRLAGLPTIEGKSFISFARYQEVCAEHGVRETVSQETLLGFLHDLGIVVNFRDDPRLAETHVLSPEWVTNGIYKILNSEWLTKRQGVLPLGHLAYVLDQQEYPRSMHLYLLDLMRKFELCYEMHGGGKHYLVPELLGKEEPHLPEFAGTEALRFNYRYNILPEGLLPRYIVRSRALNKNQPGWRTGVVVEWEGNRAVVKADLQDRMVTIAVVGNGAGRRRLLTVIRADLEVIHRSISKLQATEEVQVPGHAGLVVAYTTLRVLEAEGETELKLVHNGELVKVRIPDLLNGMEEPSAHPPPVHETSDREGVRVAFSYSHIDEELRDQLETHLKLLQRQRVIVTWHDRKILGGEDWAGIIDDNFQKADLILLLLSADFLASDYCYETEMMNALDRDAKGEARVVPVLLRACVWQDAPFGKLQGFPKDMKPVTSWSNRDEAWTEVAAGIRKIAEHLRNRGRAGYHPTTRY